LNNAPLSVPPAVHAAIVGFASPYVPKGLSPSKKKGKKDWKWWLMQTSVLAAVFALELVHAASGISLRMIP
jgi:hypothetical protein